ncbi:hydroxymethylglutaryl-CoA lyase [Novosphingobium aquimarinum]|uniref:hydroxymethylglutaryl-CoA lyase n=1 Tax=Novosphingobium aquimarinum TaxID=2682494 RepID=UPI0012EC0EB7|nr:hydroxymethylglutaryl-CoA lyase [Novosphingobium aquimarinum]
MDSIELVEVGPRDGFQSVGPVIPTKDKIAILHALHAAGIRRVEATSFVSETAVPQMADAVEVLHAAQALDGCDPQVLVPNLRHAERALRAGARHVAFVLSVSEAHNRSNVKRSPAESAAEYGRIVDLLPDGTKLRLNLATAFDCPYDGTVDDEATLALLERLLPLAPHAEIALCDTTGRVVPSHVSRLFEKSMSAFPGVKWAFHAHDTYGLGAANTLTAYNAGVRVFDASVAGLGGCPFAPGATGNVATEDLLWMFEGMQVDTGVDAAAFVDVARQVAAIPGGQTGGRVREALSSKRCAA